jgi:hypothetical protein
VDPERSYAFIAVGNFLIVGAMKKFGSDFSFAVETYMQKKIDKFTGFGGLEVNLDDCREMQESLDRFVYIQMDSDVCTGLYTFGGFL